MGLWNHSVLCAPVPYLTIVQCEFECVIFCFLRAISFDSLLPVVLMVFDYFSCGYLQSHVLKSMLSVYVCCVLCAVLWCVSCALIKLIIKFLLLLLFIKMIMSIFAFLFHAFFPCIVSIHLLLYYLWIILHISLSLSRTHTRCVPFRL